MTQNKANCYAVNAMKRITLLLSLAFALPAFAGTSAKQEIAPAPPSEPSIWRWFVGGTGGYLFDYEEPFYSAHVGVDTPWKVATADVAFYLEVGYTKPDYSVDLFRQLDFDVEHEIIPVTLNVKFEKALAGNLSAYLGAGAGVAFVDTEVRGFGGRDDDSDTVFAGQVFGGLIYNVSSNFEVYSGVRWIYLDDTDAFGDAGKNLGIQDLGDDWLVEAGVRFTF
ncbi:MAG: hypothetical protein QM680_10705 [Luteolibacter sp.]